MFDSIRNLFDDHLGRIGNVEAPDVEHSYRLATASLLLEVMWADHEVAAGEDAAVRSALGQAFSLSDAELDELLTLASQERDAAVCLHGFTRSMNELLTPEQKVHVVELMWQVAYADGDLDRYEEHLVRKVADLLYVPHAQFIRAKLRVVDG